MNASEPVPPAVSRTPQSRRERGIIDDARRPAKAQMSGQQLQFADLTLDLGRRQLYRGDAPIHLTKLDFELLRTLVVAAPNLVTRESLVEEVWGPRRIVTPENVYQRVMALRRQLDDAAKTPRYIEGVRGHGYRLIPAVTDRGGQDQTPNSDAGGSRAILGAIRLPNSVAVLPFENLSPDPANAAFAAGVHAEVVSRIAKLRNVNAISRTSVQAYAGSIKPVSEIASELGVETVLEGNVRYQGDRVRISVNLIDPYFGTSMWSETYERNLVDAFEIQTDIAVNVADALHAELFGCERHVSVRRPTDSTEAYALYMQALGKFVVNDTGVRFGALLDRVLELDPEFAEAYGLAAYWRAMSYIDTRNDDAFDSAHGDHLESLVRDLARRALVIDNTVAIAHAAIAMVDLVTWHWSASRQGFDHAHELGWSLDISPWLYSWLGDHHEAVARARHVVELSPRDWVRHLHLGIALAYAREYEDALDVLRTTAEMVPSGWLVRAWVMYVLVACGRRAEALECAATLEQMMDQPGNSHFVFLPELAYAYRRLDRIEDARRHIDAFNEIAARKDVGTGAPAMAHLALGDTARALDCLKEAAARVRRHEPDRSAINLLNLKVNFLADPLLETREFSTALAALHGD